MNNWMYPFVSDWRVTPGRLIAVVLDVPWASENIVQWLLSDAFLQQMSRACSLTVTPLG